MSLRNKETVLKDVVQAVVIADNFGDDFIPITDNKPFMLLPVANFPLIDYTLKFLSLGGIEEVFLFCTLHVDEIKEHLRKQREDLALWSLNMKVNVVVSERCNSLGDCLRDLDARGLVRSDFVLVESGSVGNVNLLPIIEKHNQISKVDKGATMTLILEEVGQTHRNCNDDLLVISSTNNRVLFYENLKKSNNFGDVPVDIFLENPVVNAHYDLRDSRISVCSASVIPLFSDNFDFQTRDDFVKGLLINEEILESTIYCHLLKGVEHAASITNWRMYQNLSHDILHRWLHPLVPDNMGNTLSNRGYVHYWKNNVYRHKTVQIAKNCTLKEDIIIGSDSTISSDTDITRSVIGDNVIIGKNVCVEDSFIFSNTRIEDGCVVKHSVVGSNCVLEPNCIVLNSSIIGNDVLLPKGTSLEESIVVQSLDEDKYELVSKLSKKAFQVTYIEETPSETDDDELCKPLTRLKVGEDVEISDKESEFSESDEELSFTESPLPDDTNLFLNEVIDSLSRGFEDKLQCDNLILEINSSRYAYNVTVKEVNFNVVKAILILPFQSSIGQPYWLSLRPLLVYFLTILKNYIKNSIAMLDCLQAVEDVAATNNELNECVAAVLNWFYDEDILTENEILRWFAGIGSSSRLKARVAPFANWLQQADEESSENDD